MDSRNILANISLYDFMNILKTSYLIPSMRPLLEDIDNQFDQLSKLDIKCVYDIYLQTKTKTKMSNFLDESAMDADYINLLRRMLSSYITKARKLLDYPDFDENFTDKLITMGIKNSLKLDDYLSNHSDTESCFELEIDLEFLKLVKSLMEVGRLRYVSPLFATVMVRCHYDSIKTISQADPVKFHDAILETNKRDHIYKGNIGDSDIQFLIDDAKVFLKYAD